MKKIPTIFMRDKRNDRQVYDAINPACQWVFDRHNDEPIGGVLRKYDGWCCSIHDGQFWKRTIVPNGVAFPPPKWQLIQCDDVNQSTIIWEPIDFNTPAHEKFILGFHNLDTKEDGVYELIGPQVRANQERAGSHRLMRHDHAPSILMVNRTFDHIRDVLGAADVYGYVFVHPDGRKAKINRTHFGFDRVNRGFYRKRETL